MRHYKNWILFFFYKSEEEFMYNTKLYMKVHIRKYNNIIHPAVKLRWKKKKISELIVILPKQLE